MPFEDDRDVVEQWLIYAKSDLELARVDLPNSVLLETLCYHAQQAAKKSLKAVLIYYSASVPKTHNIGTLIDLLEGYTRDDYEVALQLADRCFLWAKSITDRKSQ